MLRIVIEVHEDGVLQVSSSSNQPLITLGGLDLAKASLERKTLGPDLTPTSAGPSTAVSRSSIAGRKVDRLDS